MRTYPVYRLPLPSGAVVRVRKGPIAFLAAGVPAGLMLLQSVLRKGEEAERDHFFDSLETVVKACLVDDVPVECLSLGDRIAISTWAAKDGAAGALLEAELREWTAPDFKRFVKSDAALLVDVVCERYSLRPSTFMALEDAPWAHDLDVAVAYRGCAKESAASRGETPTQSIPNDYEVPAGAECPEGVTDLAGPIEGDAVIVSDMYGKQYRVPRSRMPSSEIEQGAHVVSMDAVAKRWGAGAMITTGGTGNVSYGKH